VVEDWRRLYNEELHNLYIPPNISVIKQRRMRWMGYVVHTGEMINAHEILVQKPEGKRPLRRHRHGWEDNIRMYLREMG